MLYWGVHFAEEYSFHIQSPSVHVLVFLKVSLESLSSVVRLEYFVHSNPPDWTTIIVVLFPFLNFQYNFFIVTIFGLLQIRHLSFIPCHLVCNGAKIKLEIYKLPKKMLMPWIVHIEHCHGVLRSCSYKNPVWQWVVLSSWPFIVVHASLTYHLWWKVQRCICTVFNWHRTIFKLNYVTEHTVCPYILMGSTTNPEDAFRPRN